jgi:hypothetical protein
MEVDFIIKLMFFLCDLHKHIIQLHSEQYGGHHHSDSFIMYHGQGLFRRDFDQSMKTKGGLLSFNSFLSTNKNHQLSLSFARCTIGTSNSVDILFVMTIDCSICLTPFANIRDVSLLTERRYSFLHAFYISHWTNQTNR